jgi:hypothetical protein
MTIRFSDIAIALVTGNLPRSGGGRHVPVAAVAVVSRTTPSGGKWTRIAGPATAREPEATRQRSALTPYLCLANRADRLEPEPAQSSLMTSSPRTTGTITVGAGSPCVDM